MAYEKTNWTSTTPINATNLNKIENGIADMVNVIYPIGSIYMSVNSTNPETLFGGTWEQIKDTFLLSAGDTYIAGTTGGEAEHTLTIDEMPSHSHKHNFSSNSTDWPSRTRLGSNADVDVGEEMILPTGGDQPHNNMPPYLTVYMWKRVE